MGLLLSRTHLHGENNSPQSAFYTDRFHLLACFNLLAFMRKSLHEWSKIFDEHVLRVARVPESQSTLSNPGLTAVHLVQQTQL